MKKNDIIVWIVCGFFGCFFSFAIINNNEISTTKKREKESNLNLIKWNCKKLKLPFWTRKRGLWKTFLWNDDDDDDDEKSDNHWFEIVSYYRHNHIIDRCCCCLEHQPHICLHLFLIRFIFFCHQWLLERKS